MDAVPSDVASLSELAHNYEARGAIDEARKLYERIGEQVPFDIHNTMQELRCATNTCYWQRYEHLQRLVQGAVRYKRSWVTGETAIASPNLNAEDQRICAQRNAEAICAHTKQETASPEDKSHQNALPTSGLGKPQLDGRKKLRVGFLGRDFYNQATTYLMVGLIEEHDRHSFDYIAFDYGPVRDDALHRRMVSAFDHFHRLHEESNESICDLIRLEAIDVLIFLRAPTDARCGILAMRPAKIQISYLYYPSSFGAGLVDALVADPTIIPVGMESHYSEKIIRLPQCYQPNDAIRPVPQPADREAFGLPKQAFVLANFGQAYKLTPRMFDLWCDILRRRSHCVLWLLSSHPSVIRNLRFEASVRGIHPDRLIFSPKVPTDRHLSRLTCADLALDTHPYGGHTGTSDALWAGVPVLTLLGGTFASRVAASLLKATGMDDLIARSEREYINIALQMIDNPTATVDRHIQLEARRHHAPLFDIKAYTKAFEKMLLTLTCKDPPEAI